MFTSIFKIISTNLKHFKTPVYTRSACLLTVIQFQHLKSSFLICRDTLLSANIIPDMLDNRAVLGLWKAVQRQGKPTGYLLNLVKEHLNSESDIPISSFSKSLKSLDNRRKNLMKTKSAKNESELDALMGEAYTLPVKRCIQQQPDTHSAAKRAKTVSAIEHEAVCTSNQEIAAELSLYHCAEAIVNNVITIQCHEEEVDNVRAKTCKAEDQEKGSHHTSRKHANKETAVQGKEAGRKRKTT